MPHKKQTIVLKRKINYNAFILHYKFNKKILKSLLSKVINKFLCFLQFYKFLFNDFKTKIF